MPDVAFPRGPPRAGPSEAAPDPVSRPIPGWHRQCTLGSPTRPNGGARHMPHILIVEDEPATSWALAEGLTDDGYTIDTFRTAEDAWVWLQARRSDLVISDLRLPGMSGLELAKKLTRGRHAQPVIIATAYGTPETPRDLRASGVADCFPRPSEMDGLRRSLCHALESAAETRCVCRRSDRGSVASRRLHACPDSSG